MGLEQDKIKDLFASKLGEGFEPEVPASVWGGLDLFLSQQVAAPVDPASSASSTSSSSSSAATTGKTSVFKTVAVAAGVAIAVATGLVLVQRDEPELHLPVVRDSETTPPQKTIIPHDTTFVVEEPFVKVVARKIEEPEPEKPIEIANITTPTEPEIEEKEIEPNPLEETEELFAEEAVAIAPIFDKMSIGLKSNMGVMASNISQQGGVLLFSDRIIDRGMYQHLASLNSGEYRLEHNQPISFGLTLSKELSPRLSIETGLLYTYLSSRISYSQTYDISEKQTFHYLGVPLMLNYTFYKINKTKFYLSMGGLIQKDISGQYISDIRLVDQSMLPEVASMGLKTSYYLKNSINQNKPQFSAHMNLGASFPLYQRLYLFGTVGGAYYFDANNRYRTIYSDRKMQLDLNLGVKFDF